MYRVAVKRLRRAISAASFYNYKTSAILSPCIAHGQPQYRRRAAVDRRPLKESAIVKGYFLGYRVYR